MKDRQSIEDKSRSRKGLNFRANSSVPLVLALVLVCFAATKTALAELALQVLYEFHSSGTDPNGPFGLVQGSDGYFYGATYQGGQYDRGAIFKITPNGNLTLLFSFSGTDGSGPRAPLALGRDGNFYGTTSFGGTNYNGDSRSGNGTVFKITTNGLLTTLFSFNGTNGYVPSVGILQGSDGNFYGATEHGGPGFTGPFSGNGTLFQITTNGVLTTLHYFNGSDGREPAALMQADNGDFYGTTFHGATGWDGMSSIGYGTIFRITMGGPLTTLIAFDRTNGSGPNALLQGHNGKFYGTTFEGGTNYCGTVFQFTTNGPLISLVSFDCGDCDFHPDSLAEGADGNFYSKAGEAVGCLFQISSNGTLTKLFSIYDSGSISLMLGSNGNLYGTTGAGGAYGGGTIFRLVQRPVITTMTETNGDVTLTWTSFTNGMFRVEYKPSLTVSNWTALVPDVTATNNTASFPDIGVGDAERYYRIRLLP